MKKILIFLYIAAIAVITYFLVPVFSVLGATHFLEANEELFTSSDYDLISGTVLAFRNDGTSAYVKKELLFQESYYKDENGTRKYQFDLSFFNVITKKNKNYRQLIFVKIENVYIDNSTVKLNSDNKHLLYFDIEFSDYIDVNGKKIIKSKDIFIPLYDGKSGVLIFDLKLFNNNSGPVELNKINISAPTNVGDNLNLLTLTNDLFNDIPEEDVFDVANRDLNFLKRDNISLLDIIDLNNLNNNEDFYYNQSLVKVFRTKYNYFPYFVISWIFIIFTLTYFLFVNKYVKLYLQERKMKKAQEFEELKEKIKLEDLK